ncbi:hypothetical protein [Chitinophaga qingshengii]|uniref:Uncharacterized protein n=1 Tax=Chitinophaga qingshengii TaxID=1569794 RepID=A0ABR7TL20_9BACT|nr:hypothetical protein [Chitinophaga qingshengii]MBC9931193.1 hypothetical protein [Chitinophaga qingshengii]
MKYFFSLLFLLCAVPTSAQISFPKGFKLIEGENWAGEDDRYSNGKYVFQTRFLFRHYEIWNNDQVRQDLSKGYGFPFYQTQDSLLWGTGKDGGFYSYVVVTWNGEAIELFSKDNDADFANYSKWLITTIREYRKKGKVFSFWALKLRPDESAPPPSKAKKP